MNQQPKFCIGARGPCRSFDAITATWPEIIQHVNRYHSNSPRDLSKLFKFDTSRCKCPGGIDYFEFNQKYTSCVDCFRPLLTEAEVEDHRDKHLLEIAKKKPIHKYSFTDCKRIFNRNRDEFHPLSRFNPVIQFPYPKISCPAHCEICTKYCQDFTLKPICPLVENNSDQPKPSYSLSLPSALFDELKPSTSTYNPELTYGHLVDEIGPEPGNLIIADLPESPPPTYEQTISQSSTELRIPKKEESSTDAPKISAAVQSTFPLITPKESLSLTHKVSSLIKKESDRKKSQISQVQLNNNIKHKSHRPKRSHKHKHKKQKKRSSKKHRKNKHHSSDSDSSSSWTSSSHSDNSQLPSLSPLN